MLELILMRHAKTEPTGAGLIDRNRELTERGRHDALLVGRKLEAEGWVPDRIICSPAVRTRQTLEVLLAALVAAPETEIVDALYGGRSLDYMAAIAKFGGAAQRLLVIGHNPTIHATARLAAHTRDKTLRERLAERFPTGAFALVALEADNWTTAETAPGRLMAFVSPRDIGGGSGA